MIPKASCLTSYGGAATLALAACNGTGSLGEYASDTETIAETDDGGASGGSDGGSQTSSAATDSAATDSASTDSASTDSASTDSASTDSASTGPDEGDSTDTGVPGQCEGEGNCVEFPISCEFVQCGGTSMFDAQGCVRTACTDEPLSCADGERCYRASDFGGCQSSAIDCFDDLSSMTCQCATLPDCGGAFCLPESEWPMPTPGPADTAVVQESCAPNDGPAFELRLGLSGGPCAGAPPVAAPWIAIRLDGIDAEPGTYFFGEFLGGQGNYDPGDGIVQFASSGRVVIESWDGVDVTGAYDIIMPDGTFLGADFEATYCPVNPMCG